MTYCNRTAGRKSRSDLLGVETLPETPVHWSFRASNSGRATENGTVVDSRDRENSISHASFSASNHVFEIRRNRTDNGFKPLHRIPTAVSKNDPFIFLVSSSMEKASHLSSIYDPGIIVPSNRMPIDKDRNNIYGLYVTAGLSLQIIAVLGRALVLLLCSCCCTIQKFVLTLSSSSERSDAA